MRLSIITINFNNCSGLNKTIESVISQTFNDYEWIVIDGGSTDGSRELLEQYANHFSYWVSEKDNGVYNAMNKGIKVARGEYILFLNSGDWLADKDVLYFVFSCPHSADILYGYMRCHSVDGPLGNEGMMKPTLYWYDFIGNTLPHQSSFIAKRLFDRFGLYDETYRIASDNKFFIRAIVWEKSTYEFIPHLISVFEGGGLSANDDRFVERDVRLRNEMFPKLVIDDRQEMITLRKIKSHRVLRKLYSVLSAVADRLSK